MSEPLDPTPGVHQTATGTRFSVTTDPTDFDFLVGRDIDVAGQFFAAPGTIAVGGTRMGWPSVLVELSLAAHEVVNPDEVVAGGDPELVDRLPQALACRGLRPVTTIEQAPDDERIRWTVRLRQRRAGGPSGVFGPGYGGAAGQWALITPCPPGPPPLWTALLAHTGHQCSVFVTTDTWGLVAEPDAAVWTRRLQAEVDAGRLLGARAAVLD